MHSHVTFTTQDAMAQDSSGWCRPALLIRGKARNGALHELMCLPERDNCYANLNCWQPWVEK